MVTTSNIAWSTRDIGLISPSLSMENYLPEITVLEPSFLRVQYAMLALADVNS